MADEREQATNTAEAPDRPLTTLRVREPGKKPEKTCWQLLGPGFITGASDDDPSGIGTYAQAGASFGFATLWMAWVCYPLMAAVQLICARVGQVSGRGLAGALREHYPRPVLYLAVVLLLVANTINAGTDIGAIAAAIHLLAPIPSLWLVVPVTLAILAFQAFGTYKQIEKTFKWLALALLAYVGAAFLARPDWGAVARATVLPTLRFDAQFLATVIAILGTTISPYLFFWQASQEVEYERSLGRKTVEEREGATDQEIHERTLDVNLGMAFSQLVMFFIILATGATLFKTGQHDITSATQAALALVPLAGRWAELLFALGLIGTGLLAVPILTASSAFALAEAFQWRDGLDKKPYQAKRFYVVIGVSTLLGMAINYMGINAMSALFWTAVINGVLAPPLLLIIMLVSNNRKVMGEQANGPWLNLFGWLATAAMTLAAVGLFVTWGH